MTIAEKLELIAENQQKVYDAGKTVGIKEGKQSEYDTFWDAYQQNGNRKTYQYAFANQGWDYTNFKPKYDIIMGSGYGDATSTFANINTNAGQLIDMVALCEELDITIDTSQVTRFDSTFRGDGVKRWGVIDMRNATYINNVFYGNGVEKLQRIDKIISAETTPWSQNNNFQYCQGLKYIRFEGIIGTSINFKWSWRLEKESIRSIVRALSYTASGQTLTLSKAAVDKAFETSEGANDGSDSTAWGDDVLGDVSNWTISLV